MEEAICTTEEFARILVHGDIPARLAVKDYLETLDIEMDQLTAEYVRRTMHEYFAGMGIPEEHRPHVIKTILHCAELQGLVLKKDRSDSTFVSTKRLSESWGDMFGEVRTVI